MTEVVEPGAARQTGTLEQRLERAHDVAVGQGRADGGREDQPVIFPEPGFLHLLLELAFVVGPEGRACSVEEFYLAAAARRLGGSELTVRQSAVYPQRARFQIHIAPAQRQHLAGPQPGGDGHDVESM